jgi:hypothetical protein
MMISFSQELLVALALSVSARVRLRIEFAEARTIENTIPMDHP